MAKTSKKTDPKLWENVKEDVTAGDKGGRPGQWSARKAQMAVQEYKKEGGGYVGPKSEDNSLVKWTEEDWGTKSGEKSADTASVIFRRMRAKRFLPANMRRRQQRSGATRRRGGSSRASRRQSPRRPQLIAMVCHPRNS